jgi:hypothetical protein
VDPSTIAALEHERDNYLKAGRKDRAAEVDAVLASIRGEDPKPPARKSRKRADIETAVDR